MRSFVNSSETTARTREEAESGDPGGRGEATAGRELLTRREVQVYLMSEEKNREVLAS